MDEEGSLVEKIEKSAQKMFGKKISEHSLPLGFSADFKTIEEISPGTFSYKKN